MHTHLFFMPIFRDIVFLRFSSLQFQSEKGLDFLFFTFLMSRIPVWKYLKFFIFFLLKIPVWKDLVFFMLSLSEIPVWKHFRFFTCFVWNPRLKTLWFSLVFLNLKRLWFWQIFTSALWNPCQKGLGIFTFLPVWKPRL